VISTTTLKKKAGIKRKDTTVEPNLINNSNADSNITTEDIIVANRSITTEGTSTKKKRIYNYKLTDLKAPLVKRTKKYSIIIVIFEDNNTININI